MNATTEQAQLSDTPWIAIASTIVVGLAVGVGTQILQGVLPDGWGVIANSGVMWALTAFALGAAMPTTRWAALGGAAELVVASIVYYVAVDWFEGNSSDPRGAVIWSAAGIAAGSVFGSAGHWFAHRSDHRYHALALVSGVLIGEGIHLIWFVGNPNLRPAGFVELALASAVMALSLVRAPRTSPPHSKAIIAAVTITTATSALATLELIEAIFIAS